MVSILSATVTARVIRLRPSSFTKITTEKAILKKLQGVQKIIFLGLNHHYSILSATVTTNVIRLRPPSVVTKDTYAQEYILKKITEKNQFLKSTGCPKMCFLWQNHHFSTLSAAVTTNVICLRPPLVITKDTYAQATIWKETTQKKDFLKVQGVQKMCFCG
jgi:4-aminobutyrate aminotransferase-like enzyme